MPGLLGTKNCIAEIPNNTEDDSLVVNSLCFEDLRLQVRTINKFVDDKLFYEDDDVILILEGVILNKTILYQRYNVFSLVSLVKILYRIEPEVFFKYFRGSFSGFLFDKHSRETLLFTDHIGDKPIFYSIVNGKLFFGSELKYVTELFTLEKQKYELCMSGAYSSLTYGYMISDLTYINNVRRLVGGHYLLVDSNCDFCIRQYHQFTYSPNYSITEDKIIEKIDELFCKAVEMQLNKNREYGYFDFASLSAGLDSRMTNFAIARLKNNDFTSFTYSPIGFHDQVTSADIVRLLNNRYLFQSNNTGKQLLDIDGSIFNNEGLYMYFGAAVIKDYFDCINKDNIGIIHSGQIGDVIIGCFSKSAKDRFVELENVDMHSKRFSHKFYRNFDFSNYKKLFPDREIFSIYNRGFMGVNSGANLVFQRFTETFSPFYDVEFCEFCLTIPIELRLNHYIYDKWIKSKYPIAARFKHNGSRKVGGKMNHLIIFSERVMRNISKRMGTYSRRVTSVTPLNLWCTKEEVKLGLDKYFDETIKLLNSYPELQQDCIDMYNNGTVLEKNQVLTLLGAAKLFCI